MVNDHLKYAVAPILEEVEVFPDLPGIKNNGK
jgi:hypothetical protein